MLSHLRPQRNVFQGFVAETNYLYNTSPQDGRMNASESGCQGPENWEKEKSK